MKRLYFYFKRIDTFKFLLVVLVILKQLVWMVLIPAWQFPDEQAHFAQVQNFAERKSYKPFFGPNTSWEIYKSEQLLGTIRDGFGNNRFTYHPEYKLPYATGKNGIYENEIKNYPKSYRSEYAIYEATVYPPLYYLLLTPFYNLGAKSDVFTRVFLVRLGNLPIFLSTIYFVYLIGKRLFKDHWLIYSFVVFVGFHPMFSFVGAGTSSDNLFSLIFTISIYVSILTLQKAWRGRYLLWMMCLLILGIYTKPQGRLIGSIFLWPLFLSLGKKDQPSKKFILAAVGAFLTIVFGNMIFNILSGRQMLPDIPIWNTFIANNTLSIKTHFLWTLNHTYREVVPWYWGVFRWLSLTYPRPVHRILNWMVVFSVLGLVIYLWKNYRRKRLSTEYSNLMFLIYSAGIYFLGITAYDYIFFRTHGFSFGVQGRYFFPTIVAHMAIIILGLNTLFNYLEEERKNALLKLISGGMIFFHIYAQVFVIQSYFSLDSVSAFFSQASQYKADFLKTPVLEGLVVIYSSCLLVFLWYYVRQRKIHE